MLNYMIQFFKIRLVFHMLYMHLWNEVSAPQLFFHILDTSNSLYDCSRNFEKIYQLENFCVNILIYLTIYMYLHVYTFIG